MEEYLYQTYGLSIKSDFKIDAFQEVKEFANDDKIIRIEDSAVDFKGYDFIDGFLIREYTEHGFLYVIKNVVAFLVKEDCMLMQPLCDNNKVWQSFLVGGAMSIVLIQRGYFLLHGSAVKFNSSAFLFLGLSGVGKSSVATGLGQKGYTIITDDICAISKSEEDLFISAGTKQVRLLKDAVEVLKIKDVTSLDHPNARPKFGYNFDREPLEYKTKIKTIIELVIDESMEEEVVIEEIVAFERIELLKSNIYKEDLAKTLKAHFQNFQFMMLSANNIKCTRIRRKNRNYDLYSLVDLIQKKVID